MISKAIFALATLVLAVGVFQNLKYDGIIAGVGTMSMNSWYLLALVLYCASIAAATAFEKPDAIVQPEK